MKTQQIKSLATEIRRNVLEECLRQGGGYLSQALSSAEIFACLYGELMNLAPSEGPLVPPPFQGVPGRTDHEINGGIWNGGKHADRDRFILSPSHYAQTVYAALVSVGRLAPEGLHDFNQDGSSVEMIGAEHSPGIEVSGGSFGQALAMACGIASARKRKCDSGMVWGFLSDGEFQEGVTWETLMTSAFHRLDNLRVFVDVNNQQVDGPMDEVMSIEPLDEKVAAFGWNVRRVNGHNVDDLLAAARDVTPGKPQMILADTCPFQGVDLLQERGRKLHYVRFTDEDKPRYAAVAREMAERAPAIPAASIPG